MPRVVGSKVSESADAEHRRINTAFQLQALKVARPDDDLSIKLQAYVDRAGEPEMVDGQCIQVDFDRVDDAVAFLESLHEFVVGWWNYRRSQERI